MTAEERQRLHHLESELTQVKRVLQKLGYVFSGDDYDSLTWDRVIQDCLEGSNELLKRWMALGRSIPKKLPPS